ncbi:hypothetical protein FRC03_003270 [Tulasnella sp. 419]|nr:hypothetical protein FRC03_003270 [Tulasnella sp. 419]
MSQVWFTHSTKAKGTQPGDEALSASDVKTTDLHWITRELWCKIRVSMRMKLSYRWCTGTWQSDVGSLARVLNMAFEILIHLMTIRATDMYSPPIAWHVESIPILFLTVRFEYIPYLKLISLKAC